MTQVAFGWMGFGALLLVLAIRVPIALSLMSVGLGGLLALLWFQTGNFFGAVSAVTAVLYNTPYTFVAHFSLLAIPLFLLMGSFAAFSGATTDAFAAARLWLGKLPGGLAQATIVTCAIFAAICGSSLATAAAMGRIAVPEMLRYGYDKGLATGASAVGGTLGALIPPSILMVLYGIFAEASIAKLLIAGIVPGLMTAFSYLVVIWVRSKINPSLAPHADISATFREKIQASTGTFQIGFVFFVTVVSIYAGYATVTEAAAVGAIVVLILGIVRGRLNRQSFAESLLDSAKQTGMIFAIAVGAKIFVTFIGFTGVAGSMTSWVGAQGITPLQFIIGLSIIYIILGMFLDPLGIMLLTLPIVLPLITHMGFDPIWFGPLLVKYIEIGCITPPVGLNIFVLKAVVGDTVKLETIFKGVLWFFIADIVVVAIMIAFPETVLFLPNLMLGN